MKTMGFKYKKDYTANLAYFEDRKILPSGNTIKIVFYEDRDYLNNRRYYTVYLVTTHKLKSEFSTVLKSTGKDGLSGLLWARDKVKEFEEFIIADVWFTGSFIINVIWEDNRRRRVYEYGLKPLGFKIEWLFGKKQLVKRIERK